MAKTTNKTAYTPYLKTKYTQEVRSQLQKELNLKNVNEVPKIVKISVNVGTGRMKDDKSFRALVESNLRKITGQAPVEVYAKKSIAGFKIRAGQNRIGFKVTLRGEKMYDFLEKLIAVVLPRVRDFRGVKIDAFDAQGNFSIGFKEQSVFPELDYNDTAKAHGLQVNIVTTAQDADSARALLRTLGLPFEKKENN